MRNGGKHCRGKLVLLMKNVLLIISGPAGSGKNTVAERLMAEFPNVKRVVTTTTRPPRGNERNGVDYHFVSTEEFESDIALGDFYEYAKVHGRYYGTSKKSVLGDIAQGTDLILIIDVQGAKTWRSIAAADTSIGDIMTSVFIRPNSIDELRKRLKGRATETEDEIDTRMRTAVDELKEAKHFDKIIDSGSRDEDYAALRKIYLEAKNNPARQELAPSRNSPVDACMQKARDDINIRPGTPEDFEAVYRDMLFQFPASELKGKGDFIRLFRDEKYNLGIACDKSGNAKAYFTYYEIPPTQTALLDHFAVFGNCQGKGIGSAVLKCMRKYFSNLKGLILEVEKPNPKEPNTIRRIEFYRRNGAQLLNIPYLLPTKYDSALPMDIMFLSCGDELSSLPELQIKNSIKYIFENLHASSFANANEVWKALRDLWGEEQKISAPD